MRPGWVSLVHVKRDVEQQIVSESVLDSATRAIAGQEPGELRPVGSLVPCGESCGHTVCCHSLSIVVSTRTRPRGRL
jgi:hypothetical protein